MVPTSPIAQMIFNGPSIFYQRHQGKPLLLHDKCHYACTDVSSIWDQQLNVPCLTLSIVTEQ